MIIIVRTDVDDADYRIPESVFPALADMPGEGHGVLISSRWVLTVAHALPSPSAGELSINGVSRSIACVFTHPGYRELPDVLVSEAKASGDASKVTGLLASSDDIALIKLVSPVTDVVPVVLYRGDDEVGQTVHLIGKGATGNGTDGEIQQGSNRTALRRASNVVVDADARWLRYVFDAPPDCLPLEGITGSGDSGGPVMLGEGGQRELAGLAAWKRADGDLWACRNGVYGQACYNVRVSRYVEWIRDILADGNASPGSTHLESYAL